MMDLLYCFKEYEEGVIAYEDCGVKLTVPYHVKDLEGGGYPMAGDKVSHTEYFIQGFRCSVCVNGCLQNTMTIHFL